MTNEIILDLMDKAYLVGFDIHQLTEMIRRGSTEKECLTEINKNLPYTFTGFEFINDTKH